MIECLQKFKRLGYGTRIMSSKWFIEGKDDHGIKWNFFSIGLTTRYLYSLVICLKFILIIFRIDYSFKIITRVYKKTCISNLLDFHPLKSAQAVRTWSSIWIGCKKGDWPETNHNEKMCCLPCRLEFPCHGTYIRTPAFVLVVLW